LTDHTFGNGSSTVDIYDPNFVDEVRQLCLLAKLWAQLGLVDTPRLSFFINKAVQAAV